MTNPDNVIAKLNAEIEYYAAHNDHVVTERVLVEAREMIRTLKKERDESEAMHFTLGYN